MLSQSTLPLSDSHTKRNGMMILTKRPSLCKQWLTLTFVPCILILSKYFIHQLIHKWLF